MDGNEGVIKVVQFICDRNLPPIDRCCHRNDNWGIFTQK